MATGSDSRAHGQNPLTSKFDKLVAQAFDSWKFLGLSIAVIDGPQDFTKVHHFAIINALTTQGY